MATNGDPKWYTDYATSTINLDTSTDYFTIDDGVNTNGITWTTDTFTTNLPYTITTTSPYTTPCIGTYGPGKWDTELNIQPYPFPTMKEQVAQQMKMAMLYEGLTKEELIEMFNLALAEQVIDE